MNARQRKGILYLLLSMELCLGLPGQSRAATDQGAGQPWFERENCLVIDARKGVATPDFDATLCGETGTGSIGTNYGWLPAFLIDALDTAEQAACGKVGCALKDRAVRVYITWGQVPRLESGRSKTKLVLSMNTALIDLVESSITTVFQDVKNGNRSVPYGSFKDWLNQVDHGAGHTCQAAPNAFATLKRRPKGIDEFIQVRTMGQAFYRFVFAHELAHVLKGEACGAGVDAEPLTLEKQCDRVAFHWLSAPNLKMMLPPLVIVPSVALGHYVAVLDPMFPRKADSRSLSEENPAIRWLKRADAVLADWDSLCRSESGPDVFACRQGWQGGVNDMRNLVNAPAPGPCTLSSTKGLFSDIVEPILAALRHLSITSSAYADSQNPAKCLRIVDTGKKKIDWVSAGDPPIVKMNLRYRNTCDRPIHCKLSVVSGTIPRTDPPRMVDWRPGQKKTDEFTLATAQFYDLTETLDWYADEARMPAVRFPQPPGDDMEYADCRFAGSSASAAGAATQSDVNAFFSFMGMNYGDSKASVVAKYGSPKRQRTSTDSTVFEYSGLSFSFDKTTDKLKVIDLESAEAVQRAEERGISDPKTRYLGLSKDAVVQAFGPPKSSDSDVYEYKLKANGQRGILDFECYDFNDYRCEEIRVHWFY